MAEIKHYTDMRSTRIDWLGDVPASWPLRRLKYIFSIKKDIAGELGHTVLSVTQKGIRPKDMKDKGQFALDYSKYQLVHSGDFVMNHMDLLTGWVDISEYEGVTSPDYRVFVNSDPEQYVSEYYKYIFQLCYSARVFYGLGQGVSGFGRWRLPADMFLNFELPVPSRVEQIRIAEYLQAECEHSNSIIDEANSCIEEYKKWRASFISEIITKGLDPNATLKNSHDIRLGKIPSRWGIAKIKQVAKINPSCSTEGISPEEQVTFAPMECIRTDHRIERNASLAGNNGSYSSFNNGDIALAKVTPCFQNGNVCIMENLINDYAYGSSELFNIRPVSINPRFLLYYFMTEEFKEGGVASMTGVAGLQRVPANYIRNAVIPIPPQREQDQIVSYLDGKCQLIDSLITEKISLIADLESYKQSLIYEAVTGKRKVV